LELGARGNLAQLALAPLAALQHSEHCCLLLVVAVAVVVPMLIQAVAVAVEA
jgi:hypothetical protein